MLLGKHINRYYLKYLPILLLGLASLVMVDFFQLEIPELYRMVINGINDGEVLLDGKIYPFDMDFLLDHICLPLIFVLLAMILGRFLWRICFFGTGVRTETQLRRRMFEHCTELSQEYYQENKVGNLMALFTNDLDTVQECFGWGVMMLFDALLLGVMSIVKMMRMDWKLASLTLIPMAFLLVVSTLIGKYMMRKWDERQQAYSDLSDFSQETISGMAVIKAFVKEGKELLFFKTLNKNNEKTNVAHARASVLLRVFVMLFVESVVCIILGYGGYLVYCGTFNAGELVEFIGYFTAIVWPIMAISELIDMQSRGKASLNRIS